MKLFWLIRSRFPSLCHPAQMKKELLSGLTVALALIPEAIAFAFVAGVHPLVGLYAAFIIWFITSIFGGRPWMISGATWALAIIIVSLVKGHWVEYLFATVVLMGIFQILFGVLRLWKLVRLIPHTVMLGFVNGLAIIIFIAQLWQFKVGGEWLSTIPLLIMWGLILLTMAIIHFLPKFTSALPSGLVAIVVVSLLVIFVPWLEEVRTVSSYLIENWFSSIQSALPSFHLPVLTTWLWETLKIITPYALIMAIVGLTESLMTLTLIDEKTNTRGKANKESIGQGLANIVCGFFGGMGGCAMIWQSMINISNGWKWRLSSLSASVFLLILIVFASGLLMKIPLAALVWLMFIVVIGTFARPTFKTLLKVPRADALVIILVTVITVWTWDLAIAVISGVVISALVFAWEKSKQITSKKYTDKDGCIHYELNWPLFFGSVSKFKELFDITHDPKEVIIDFANAKVMDHSAIEAINSLTEKYLQKGKKLHLKHLSSDCRQLLKDADKIIDVNIYEDPKYHVADDKLA